MTERPIFSYDDTDEFSRLKIKCTIEGTDLINWETNEFTKFTSPNYSDEYEFNENFDISTNNNWWSFLRRKYAFNYGHISFDKMHYVKNINFNMLLKFM